jgi:hypothetical protein
MLSTSLNNESTKTSSGTPSFKRESQKKKKKKKKKKNQKPSWPNTPKHHQDTNLFTLKATTTLESDPSRREKIEYPISNPVAVPEYPQPCEESMRGILHFDAFFCFLS